LLKTIALSAFALRKSGVKAECFETSQAFGPAGMLVAVMGFEETHFVLLDRELLC